MQLTERWSVRAVTRRVLVAFCALHIPLLPSAAAFAQARQDRNPPAQVGQKRRATNPSPAEVALVRQSAYHLTEGAHDYTPLMEAIGDTRFVLLGEATHGTHEFYRERARITRRLIEEKGFNVVVLEADWPDAHRVNQYVRGRGKDGSARESLSGFKRFPRWMWRNADFAGFVEWLRSYNDSRPPGAARAGIYGMDLYNLADSAEAVVQYLKLVDREAAKQARRRYDCLGGYRGRPEQYGSEVAARLRGSCEKQAAAQLSEMEQRFAVWRSRPDRKPDEELLSAYLNARAVKNGEAYYRLLYARNFSTWNLRDSHMADTIQELAGYVDALGGDEAKVVVWAHNSHQGDAKMTRRGELGELNVGHLMRRFHGGKAFLIGFTTYAGEVMAATEWGAGGRRMKVRPALDESYSALFHQAGVPNFLLLFRGNERLTRALGEHRLQRAIGVVYLKDTERQSHYSQARMSKQFDAVIHWDVTRSVESLE